MSTPIRCGKQWHTNWYQVRIRTGNRPTHNSTSLGDGLERPSYGDVVCRCQPPWARGDRYADEKLLAAQETFWRILAARLTGKRVTPAALGPRPALDWDAAVCDPAAAPEFLAEYTRAFAAVRKPAAK